MENKSYYAIIPASVRYDKNICPNAKLLYGEITALCNEKGFCWANNNYFMSLYLVGKNTIVRWINELVSNGYIMKNIQFAEDGKTVIQRCLSLPNDTRWYQNCNEGSNKKDTTPGIKNDTYNNTMINNTENITLSKKVSKNKDNAHARESYQELFVRLGLNDYTQSLMFKYIQFVQINKKTVTNYMLESQIRKLKYEAECRIRNTILGNYFERHSTDLSLYQEDIDNYLQMSIKQALNGKYYEFKEPKNYQTRAESEDEASKL